MCAAVDSDMGFNGADFTPFAVICSQSLKQLVIQYG